MHIPEQTYLIHKFIKFRGCLEAASERTNLPLSFARTWTPFKRTSFGFDFNQTRVQKSRLAHHLCI